MRTIVSLSGTMCLKSAFIKSHFLSLEVEPVFITVVALDAGFRHWTLHLSVGVGVNGCRPCHEPGDLSLSPTVSRDRRKHSSAPNPDIKNGIYCATDTDWTQGPCSDRDVLSAQSSAGVEAAGSDVTVFSCVV